MKDDGKYKYISTSELGKNSIESVNDSIKITNEETKEIKYLQQKSIIPNQSSIGVSTNQFLLASDTVTWNLYGSRYSSSMVDAANASLIAGILAAILGGPVTGVITSIATYIYSRSIDEIWYAKYFFQDADNMYHYKDEVYYYADEAYNEFLGRESYIYYSYM